MALAVGTVHNPPAALINAFHCCFSLRIHAQTANVEHVTDSTAPMYFFVFFSKNVSCEFDQFRVDTRLCKLRDTPAARFSHGFCQGEHQQQSIFQSRARTKKGYIRFVSSQKRVNFKLNSKTHPTGYIIGEKQAIPVLE